MAAVEDIVTLKNPTMPGVLHQINRSDGGLPKRAVPHPIMLQSEGVEGDRQRNLKIHGGPDKAVLMIASETIDSLAVRGFPVYYGALGENLTVTGLDPGRWRSGQRYRIGPDAVIEFTKLRAPCTNLDVYGPPIKAEIYDARCKAGDFTSPHWAHGGFYARVLHRGLLFPGAPVILESDAA